MSLVYINKVPASLRNAFESEVRAICSDLKIKNPDWLMVVIQAESNFVASAKSPNSTAVGLIQFIESTANSLGTTTAEIAKMNHVEQLRYVRAYLTNTIRAKGIPKDGYQLYFMIHYPRAVNLSDTTIIYQKPSGAYNGNSGLDYNKDGAVQVQEVKKYLNSKVPFPYTSSLLTSESESAKTTNLLLNMFLLFFFGGTGYYLLFKGGWSNVKYLVKSYFKR